MSVESAITQAMDDLFADIGQAAVYTPSAGDPVACQVDISQVQTLQPGGFDGQVYAVRTTIEYRLAEVGVVASRGETFTVGSVTWTVDGVIEQDDRMVKVVVK